MICSLLLLLFVQKFIFPFSLLVNFYLCIISTNFVFFYYVCQCQIVIDLENKLFDSLTLFLTEVYDENLLICKHQLLAKIPLSSRNCYTRYCIVSDANKLTGSRKLIYSPSQYTKVVIWFTNNWPCVLHTETGIVIFVIRRFFFSRNDKFVATIEDEWSKKKMSAHGNRQT